MAQQHNHNVAEEDASTSQLFERVSAVLLVFSSATQFVQISYPLQGEFLISLLFCSVLCNRITEHDFCKPPAILSRSAYLPHPSYKTMNR